MLPDRPAVRTNEKERGVKKEKGKERSREEKGIKRLVSYAVYDEACAAGRRGGGVLVRKLLHKAAVAFVRGEIAPPPPPFFKCSAGGLYVARIIAVISKSIFRSTGSGCDRRVADCTAAHLLG